MPLFGPPDVEKLVARGKIEGLVQAARYKRDPAVAKAAQDALTGLLDDLIQRLETNNLRQLAIARDGLRVIGPPAVERLIFVLRHGHVHRREDAAYALGEMGDPAAIAPLAHALDHPDPLLRMIAATALGKIGDPRAVDPLRGRLADPNGQVSRAVRKSLVQLGAEE